MAKVTKNIKAFSPTVQRTDELTRNKHTRIAPVSHMNPGGSSVEMTLGNPQVEKKNKWKTWSRPRTQIAPFVVYNDMEDRGNLEEEQKDCLEKILQDPKGRFQIKRKKKSKREPFANEMGRMRY